MCTKKNQIILEFIYCLTKKKHKYQSESIWWVRNLFACINVYNNYYNKCNLLCIRHQNKLLNYLPATINTDKKMYIYKGKRIVCIMYIQQLDNQ